MKTFFKISVMLFIVTLFSNSYSQDLQSGNSNSKNNTDHAPTNPLYQLRVTNITTGVDAPTGNNAIFFDIYILHTNLANSGPFEFAAGQYYLLFNPVTIANGGTLTYSTIPNSTLFSNPDAVPINPNIAASQLRLEKNININPGQAPIVSSVYPGTRVVSAKLVTTAPTINAHQLELRWLQTISNNHRTEIFAYVDSVSTDITGDGTYLIDTIDFPLPVELSGFTSGIIRNNVMLNWSTSSELNNYGFDIERISGNNVWEKVGFLKGFGNSNSSISYSFEDKNLTSGNYNYRLKQIDVNGNYEYFNLTNEINIGAPDKFSLKQNYPNPFNPATKIDFDIPVNGNVSLKVFDINGREVKTLVNEFKNQGYYSIDFNASALPSGVYYYILNSGSFSSTKKLILLK